VVRINAYMSISMAQDHGGERLDKKHKSENIEKVRVVI
jgi:hypothetical protein